VPVRELVVTLRIASTIAAAVWASFYVCLCAMYAMYVCLYAMYAMYVCLYAMYACETCIFTRIMG